MTADFAYDAVDYPSAALPLAHPGHLYAVARMFGADPAPVERCRYLELGCGDGTHLIACAVGLPDATFVGVDLSAAAIDRGNRLIAELGLRNVSLHAADVTRWEPPPGAFDYAAAHGLYSWVPAPVRDAVLGLYASVLGRSGIGFVSYNTFPGCHVRQMLGHILKFHTARIPDPAVKMQQAAELARFLRAGRPTDPDPALTALAPEIEELEKKDPRVLFHDDLADVNDPVYFHEFAAHAGRFGLRFVAEAEPAAMAPRAYPAVAEALEAFGRRDVLMKEQYLDFLRLRRFRQTLLSPDGRSPQLDPDPQRLATLAVSGKPESKDGPADLTPGVAVAFSRDTGATVRTDLPVGKAAMVVLAEGWPARLPFPELVRAAAEKLDREPTAEDADNLARLLTRMWTAGLVAFHGHVPRYTATASERPVASPLARVQLRTGPTATTVLHATMRFDDAPSRLLVQLLDGTRDREQLANDILPAFPAENRPDAAAMREGVERNLDRVAKAGLLVG